MASFVPTVVYLSIDTSKSMEEMEGDVTRLQALSKSLVDLIASMKKECSPSTRIVVETFFEETVLSLFEGVLESFAFETVEKKLLPDGGTPLYYVVYKGLDFLAHQPEENRIFICLTDGVNTTMPQYHTLARKVVAEAPVNKTTVFFIGNSDAVTANASTSVGVSENSLFTMDGGQLPAPLIRAITRETSVQSQPVEAVEAILEPPKLTRETCCNFGDSEDEAAASATGDEAEIVPTGDEAEIKTPAREYDEYLFEPPPKMMRTTNMC